MPTSASDHPARRNWLLILGAVAALLLDAGVMTGIQDRLHRQIEEHTLADAERVLLAMEDRTVRLLETGDILLHMARRQWLHGGDLSELRTELADAAFPSSERFNVSLILTDGDGSVIFDSEKLETPAVNIKDLTYFRALRAAHEDLVVLDPTRIGRLRGIPLFRLARPMFKDGRFEGVAIFTFSPDFLEDLFRQYGLGPGANMSFLSMDRRVIARAPKLSADYLDRPLDELNLWRQMVDRDHGTYVAASGFDGVRRLNLFHRLPKYNAVVKVGIPEADILAVLSQSRQMLAAVAGGLLAALAAAGCLLFGLLGGSLRPILARDGEGRFRALFDGAQSVMLVVDPENNAIIDANQSAARFYGYEPAVLKAMRLTDINLQLDTTTLKDIGDGKRSGQNEFLFRHRLADGQTRDVEVLTGPVEVRGRRLLFSVIHDITDRRRRDADSARLTQAVDQSPLSVVITDPEGAIQYVNAAFTAASGYAAEDVLGQTPRILKTGETAAADYAAMWAELAAGNSWRGRFHNRRKDGSRYWAEAVIWPVTDDRGRIIHHFGLEDVIPEGREPEPPSEDSP
ncbi:MAG TPA: PAS domain S-box protein [Rhodospirillaceae bacterium]|nr:PAS domain S-box protein [Rhodospirillaceae bacterium]